VIEGVSEGEIKRSLATTSEGDGLVFTSIQICYDPLRKHKGNIMLDTIHFGVGDTIGKNLTDNSEDTIVDSMRNIIGQVS
jgi:hypothetical protein